MIVILAVAVFILLAGVFVWIKEVRKLSSGYNGLSAQIVSLGDENQAVERDIAYYLNPQNLEKKLREKFNYKSAGEKMIIIIPK